MDLNPLPSAGVTSAYRLFRLSAWASLLCCACYCIGLATVFFVAPGLNKGAEERLAFILESGHILQAWYFVIYVIFGICLITLNVGLRRWLMPSSSAMLQLSFITGWIWAAYVFASGLISILAIQYLLSLPYENQKTIWYAIYSIQSGLGEGVEWVGGLWMIFLSLHILKHGRNHAPFGFAGLVIGVCGALTMLPSLALAGAVFGVSQTFWFIALGQILFACARRIKNEDFTPISPQMH